MFFIVSVSHFKGSTWCSSPDLHLMTSKLQWGLCTFLFPKWHKYIRKPSSPSLCCLTRTTRETGLSREETLQMMCALSGSVYIEKFLGPKPVNLFTQSNRKSSEIRDILHFLELQVHEKNQSWKIKQYLFTVLLFLSQTSWRNFFYLTV